MTIGFIGTGVISEAMIRGLCDVAGYTDQIAVSKRSSDRSKRLSEAYSNITICETNTDVVNQSDWVFVGVLPDQVEMVLQALSFKTKQKVISLAAGVSLEDLKRYIHPCEHVIRAIPMPPIEFGKGPLAICPSDDAFETFANTIGVVVSIDDENQYNLFGAASALMSDFFAQIASVSKWMQLHGLDPTASARYACALYESLALLATKESAESLSRMSEACQTPGGLNEQFFNFRQSCGVDQSLHDGLNQILERLESSN